MNTPKLKNVLWAVLAFGMLLGMGVFNYFVESPKESPIHLSAPKTPKTMTYSLYRTGPYEVAKIFGRSKGCQTADVDFINTVNNSALAAGADPRLIASVIAQESSCNPLAVSSKGAIGIMQVLPRVWKDSYDFSEQNLFNPATNIRIGSEILSSLVREYGEDEGLRRYQGIGIGGVPTYVAEVERRAGN